MVADFKSICQLLGGTGRCRPNTMLNREQDAFQVKRLHYEKASSASNNRRELFHLLQHLVLLLNKDLVTS